MQRITLDSEISYVVTEKELKEIRTDERNKTIDEVVKALNYYYQEYFHSATFAGMINSIKEKKVSKK